MTVLSLAGKVAIVTGAGRGLGRSMARGLARAGAKVVLTAARARDELDAAAAEIAAERGDHPSRCCGAPREPWLLSRFWEMPAEIWQMVIATNVNGPFLMARAAMPYFLKAGKGRIINISMNWQTMRRKGFTPYGPSKAALESTSMIWAQDLAGTGITVNTLLPGGATATGMVPAGVRDEVRATLLDSDVIVPPLIWLASDAADGVIGKRITATEWSLADPKMTDAGI